MIGQKKPLPSDWFDDTIWNPGNKCMFDSKMLLDPGNIWLSVSAFIFDDREKITEDFLDPGILWRFWKVKGSEPPSTQVLSIPFC